MAGTTTQVRLRPTSSGLLQYNILVTQCISNAIRTEQLTAVIIRCLWLKMAVLRGNPVVNGIQPITT